jgi:hypothetical protein
MMQKQVAATKMVSCRRPIGLSYAIEENEHGTRFRRPEQKAPAVAGQGLF